MISLDVVMSLIPFKESEMVTDLIQYGLQRIRRGEIKIPATSLKQYFTELKNMLFASSKRKK